MYFTLYLAAMAITEAMIEQTLNTKKPDDKDSNSGSTL